MPIIRRKKLLSQMLWTSGENGLKPRRTWRKDEEIGLGNWIDGIW